MRENFRKKILGNGLTILFEKRRIPVVSIAFAVRQGGINEPSDEKGISHFIEHMLYKGTKNRNAKQIAEEIERNGGFMNGFTDETMTAFWCKLPYQHFQTGLDVLSDIMRNPLFDEKEIEKERKVIFEEIKMRKDNPGIYVLDEIHGFLYKEPFGSPLIGNYKTMNSLNREKLVEKFGEIYKPSNMILCVVGNANFENIVKFAEKTFGKTKERINQKNFKIVKKNQSKTEKRRGINQSSLVFAYHVPEFSKKECYAAKILSVLTAEGMSSRLFEEIREKRNLAYAVKGESDINKDFAYNLIYVGTTKQNVSKVRKIILNEFEKISKELSEEELNRVKEQLIGNYQISMEDTQSQMSNLLFSEINGKAEDFYDFEKKIKQVKLKEVKEISKNAVKNYSFFSLVPN